VILDEKDKEFNDFWNFIKIHRSFYDINREARSERIRPKAYINNQLRKLEPNTVKDIYNDWVSQGQPKPFRKSLFTIGRRSSVTPVIHLPSPSRGKGITKRKKRRKPRKKKSVKKRKGKSKKKRVRRKRKSRRRS